MVELSEQVFQYYLRVKNFIAAANVASLHVEHIYYKHDSIAQSLQKSHVFTKTWGQYKDLHPASLGNTSLIANNNKNVEIIHPGAFSGNPSVQTPSYNAASKLEELSNFIFKYGDDRSRTRALLCVVFHYAVHDRYYAARDMFLISHIQETIDKTDIKTQILYNRALVMIGLCAFRLGLIQKSHDALTNICSNRLKELLAQGQSYKYYDKDREQEKIERRRQLPYHMHINPDLLESCHLISAMFLELPLIAKNGGIISSLQNPISKQFRKYFQTYNKQIFTGPPENSREMILSASKALLNGQWKKACELLLTLDAWNLLPGDGSDKIKILLSQKVKEEGVRLYLLTYGIHFESISLNHICEIFEMDILIARRIISQMIFNKEISAAWEHPADTLIIYKVDPSTIETLAQTVTERINNVMESNERLLDPFTGIYGYKDDNYGRDNRKQYGDDKQNPRRQWKSGGSGSRNGPRVVANRVGGGSRNRNVSGTNKIGNVWSAGKKHDFNARPKPQHNV